MGADTKIQWCHHTFNPWRGCTKVSRGCANCYAEAQAKRNPGVLGIWGDGGTRVVASEAKWREVVTWDRKAREAGERHRVFCASMADVFEDRPELVAPRVRLFHLINETPNLDWLLLTKRPQNIRKFCGDTPRSWAESLPSNVWLGVSVEGQETADARIPELLSIPAKVRFVSYEPALGPVDFSAWIQPWLNCGSCDASYGLERAVPDPDGHPHGADQCAECGREGNMVSIWGTDNMMADQYGDRGPNGETLGSDGPGIDWIIVGGESGPKARLFDLDWARSTIDQCKAAGVACFVKQLGAKPFEVLPVSFPWEVCNRAEDFPLELKDSHGGDWDEWPADLRVREFPEVKS